MPSRSSEKRGYSNSVNDRIREAIDSADRTAAVELYSAFGGTADLVPIDVVSVFFSGDEFVSSVLPHLDVNLSGAIPHVRIDHFETIRRALNRGASKQELRKIRLSHNMNQKLVCSDGTHRIRRQEIRSKGQSVRYNPQYTFKKSINGREVSFPVGTSGAEGLRLARKIHKDIDNNVSASLLRKRYHPNSKVLRELERAEVLSNSADCQLGNIGLEEAIDLVVQAKEEAGRSPHTVRQASSLLNGFKNFMSKTVEFGDEHTVRDITEQNVRKFLKQVPERSQIHNYTAVNNLLRWAEKRDYINRNPCRLIEKPQRILDEVEVLSCDECRALLEAAMNLYDGEMLAAVAMMIFLGVRPDSEIKYLNWDNLNWEDSEIRVVKGKVKSKRMVGLSENLVEWLKICDQSKPLYYETNFRRRMATIRRAAGFKGGNTVPKSQESEESARKEWGDDYARHTAISCHLRITEDYGKTATWAGTSVKMIRESYDGLVSRSFADEFWSIFPPESEEQLSLF